MTATQDQPSSVDTPRRKGLSELTRPAIRGGVGSVACALASFDVGVLPNIDGSAAWFGTHIFPVLPVAGQLLAWLAFYGGLALLAHSWISLGKTFRSLQQRNVIPERTLIRLVLVIAVAWAIPLVVGAPLASRDVYSYAAQGRMVAKGSDPYVQGPAALGTGPFLAGVDPIWRSTPTPYGPVFLDVAARAAALPTPQPVVAVLALRLAALVGLAALAWAIVGLARIERASPSVALWLVLANPLVLLHLVSGAHNEALMLGLGAVGALVAARRHPLLGAVIIGVAALIKLPVLGVAVFIGLRWGRRGDSPLNKAIDAASCVAVAGLSMVAVTMLTGGSWGWVSALGVPGSVSSALSASHVVGSLASALGGGTATATFVDLAFIAFGGCVAAALLTHARVDGIVVLGAALTAVALTGPAVHPWYLVWGIPFLAIGATDRRANAIGVLSIVPLFLVAPGGSGFQTALTGVDTSVLIGAPIVFMIALVASRPLRETVRSLPRRLAGTGRLGVDSLRWVIARVRQALLHSDAPGVTAVP